MPGLDRAAVIRFYVTSMNDSGKSVLWTLWPYLARYKKLWIAGFLSVVLSGIFAVMAPWILREAIISLEVNMTAKGLALYAGKILGVTAISALFTYFMRQTMIVASRRIENDFRNDIFSHLLWLDRTYYDHTPTGDIMARASNDMEAVRNMIGPGIMYSFTTAVRMTLILTIMIKLNPMLTLYTMLPMPVIVFLVFYLGQEVNKRYTKIQEKYSDITTHAQENFSGIRVVKAYVQERAEIADFARMGREYIRENLSMVRIWGLFFPAIGFFGGLAIIMVIWFGGSAVARGTMTLGDFVAFSAYLFMALWPMVSLGWVAGLYQRGKVSLKRLKQMLDARPVVTDPPNGVRKKIEGKIEFNGLRFAYNGQPILNGIDVTIEPGMRVAIIGGTGSGKTTLVSLLLRAYPVERGMIFIDGIEINNFVLESLRSQIAPVMQETFLFSETIRSNIAYGDANKNFESIRVAAQAAGLASDIEGFPKKYDTILGERGITLSGGQKQRVALARALAADPRILILDDAFSSVDTHTEDQILTNLRQTLAGRTTIMISHRISTVKNADLILVLSRGKIIERGRHDELLAQNGHYANLYEKQLLKEELEAL
jgi:ATP-binding cassette subfamily B protein